MSSLDYPFDRRELLNELLVPAGSEPPEWTSLGEPVINSDGRSDAAVGQLMARSFERAFPPTGTIRAAIESSVREIDVMFQRDLAIMHAVGLPKRRTTPWTNLRASVYAQLRAILVGGGLRTAADLQQRSGADLEPALMRSIETLGQTLILIEAAPFFIPVALPRL